MNQYEVFCRCLGFNEGVVFFVDYCFVECYKKVVQFVYVKYINFLVFEFNF